jgi:hypothetical protein
MVCTDACKEGLGGVLSQNVFEICFESKKLKEHESLYTTHDLNLEDIVHALKKWRRALCLPNSNHEWCRDFHALSVFWTQNISQIRSD